MQPHKLVIMNQINKLIADRASLSQHTKLTSTSKLFTLKRHVKSVCGITVCISILQGHTGTSLLWQIVASQARLFRAVAELNARESREEEELLPE